MPLFFPCASFPIVAPAFMGLLMNILEYLMIHLFGNCRQATSVQVAEVINTVAPVDVCGHVDEQLFIQNNRPSGTPCSSCKFGLFFIGKMVS